MREAPRISWEPSVLQGWGADVRYTRCIVEAAYSKDAPRWIYEYTLMSAHIDGPAFTGYQMAARGTEDWIVRSGLGVYVFVGCDL